MELIKLILFIIFIKREELEKLVGIDKVNTFYNIVNEITKTFIVLLILTIILVFIDYKIINNFVNYDEIQRQEQIKEEREELIAIKDYDYNKVEQYLNNGWNPNETTKAIYYAIKY